MGRNTNVQSRGHARRRRVDGTRRGGVPIVVRATVKMKTVEGDEREVAPVNVKHI